MKKYKIKKIDYYSPIDGEMNITPSKNFIPEWYKGIKSYSEKNIQFGPMNNPLKTIKNCVPFLDSLTSGYMIELWSDVHFKKTENGHFITWASDQPVDFRKDNSLDTIPIPQGHSNDHYTWLSPFFIELPIGYSALVTHPFNRFDLPFTTMSGIIDKQIGRGNFPFFIKNNFEGIIKKGTPIAQILPFKTEDWQINKNENLSIIDTQHCANVKKKFFGYYKNNIWKRKRYL
jgi:hypothetical protein